ncbi:MAG: choice-of-anchor J domain-containing protein [Chitinophagales bacterium]
MKSLPLLLAACFPMVNYAQVILQTGFEDAALPAGWTQITVADDGGWRLGDNHDLASAIFPVKPHGNFIGTNDICFCDHSNDLLISPELDLSGYTNLMLMFDYNYLDFDPQSFTVEVSTNGGLSWTVFESLSFSAGGYFGYWETKYEDFSAYAGLPSVMIAFRYSDGGDWWSYGASLDNVKLWQPLAFDIALDSVELSDEFAQVGSGITIGGVVHNFGTATIHAFDAVWNNGVDEVSETITGMDIPSLGTAYFTHPVDIIPSTPDTYDVQLTLENPEGNPDAWPADNAMDTVIHGCSTKPTKVVVAEMATGTWCGWCTRGILYMDSMYLLHPQNFIGVEVHNNDPMEDPAYDSAMYAYQNYLSFNGGAAYPAVIAEHKKYIDPQDMPLGMLPYFEKTVPAYVNVYGTYDTITNEAEIHVKTTLLSNLNDIDYRLNLILTEDSVTGTGIGWEQYNAYGDGLFGDMGGYELLPDPIPADMMHYDHVARLLADGWDGAAGSIAGSVFNLDTFSRIYDVVIPDDWNEDRLNLIGLIYDHRSGYFINAKSIHLTDLTWTSNDTTTDTTILQVNTDDLLHVRIFPNPASDICFVDPGLHQYADLHLEIYNINGNLLVQKDYVQVSPGTLLPVVTVSMANGMYTIRLSGAGCAKTKQIIVQHTE